MRFLPICLNTQGQRILVVGAGREARLKVRMLREYACEVAVCAPEIPTDLLEQAVTPLERPYGPDALCGAAVVYACTEDRWLNRRIGEDARAAGILVNVVDDPSHCDFVTPALYRKGYMSVAVSSDGEDVARSIAWRDQLRDLVDALGDGEPSARSRREEPASPVNDGKVWLVGFGPGDPGLLTRKAHRVLLRAERLVYDDLVDAEALSAYPGVKQYVGKRGGRAGCATQQEINELLYAAAARGEHVARVKGGDPLVFSRGGEELAYLRARGIHVEIVPGVSAVLAAAACGGFPLTMRGLSHRVELRTGHNCSSDPADAPARGTVVYYMAAARLGEIARELVAESWPLDTLVALVESASLPTERWRVTTLGALGHERAASPVILVIGEVVRLAHPAQRDESKFGDAKRRTHSRSKTAGPQSRLARSEQV